MFSPATSVIAAAPYWILWASLCPVLLLRLLRPTTTLDIHLKDTYYVVTRGYLTGVSTWTLLGQVFLYYLLRELPLTDWMTVLHVCSTVALTL